MPALREVEGDPRLLVRGFDPHDQRTHPLFNGGSRDFQAPECSLNKSKGLKPRTERPYSAFRAGQLAGWANFAKTPLPPSSLLGHLFMLLRRRRCRGRASLQALGKVLAMLPACAKSFSDSAR
jgi:hypothetical protein